MVATLLARVNIDDDILSWWHLDNGLNTLFSETKGVIGRFLMEGCTCCRGIDFSHRIKRVSLCHEQSVYYSWHLWQLKAIECLPRSFQINDFCWFYIVWAQLFKPQIFLYAYLAYVLLKFPWWILNNRCLCVTHIKCIFSVAKIQQISETSKLF